MAATLTLPQTIYLRYTYLEPVPEKQAVSEDYRKWFMARLRRLDAHLKDREYLVDGRFTIADIAVGYALIFARSMHLHEQFEPQTLAYLERITARPAFNRANQQGEPMQLPARS